VCVIGNAVCAAVATSVDGTAKIATAATAAGLAVAIALLTQKEKEFFGLYHACDLVIKQQQKVKDQNQ